MDQALASLRIETSPFKADRYANRIRLSRACGLKPFRHHSYAYTILDQALASLRIETESHEVILWDTNRSGSREPAD